MKKDNINQRPLDAIERALDDETAATDRPRGMPSLPQIKALIVKLGLPESDAEYIYDIWLMNGFRTRTGRKVYDWKAAVRIWKRFNYFPSLKDPKPAHAPPAPKIQAWIPPTLEEIKAHCHRKHWSLGFAKHCYSTWMANNWRHYGQPISSDEQWKALMESMEYKP